MKTKQEYRADLLKGIIVFAFIAFVAYFGLSKIFHDYPPQEDYIGSAIAYVVVSLILAEFIASNFFDLAYKYEGVSALITGIVLGAIFLIAVPIHHSNEYRAKTKWQETSKTFSKVVFYDDTHTIVNDSDGSIINPSRNNYYKMKHAITKGKGFCEVNTRTYLRWDGKTDKEVNYCK